MHQIMIVDDEENILKSLRRIFRSQADWEIESYTNVQDAIKRAKIANFDLFLSDYRMPEMNGVEFLSKVKVLQPHSMRLILSGHTDLEALLGAINEAEIFRFVTKPWEDYELIATIKNALSFHDVLSENRHLANQVREQEQQLKKQKTAIEKLQAEHPGLFEVNWGNDGSIILDGNDS